MAGQRRSTIFGWLILAASLGAASPSNGDEWTDFHFSVDPTSPADQNTFDLRAWRWFPDSGYSRLDQSINVTGNQVDVYVLVQDFHTSPDWVFLTVMTPVGAYFDDYGPLAAGEYQVNAQMWKTFSPNSPGSLYDTATFSFTVTEASVGPLLAGDYNDDGRVDSGDYTVWRNSAGRTGADLAADGNGDLVVDEGDYLMWKDHFGQVVGSGSSAGSSAGSLAAPEPGALLLALVGAATIGFGRRR